MSIKKQKIDNFDQILLNDPLKDLLLQTIQSVIDKNVDHAYSFITIQKNYFNTLWLLLVNSTKKCQVNCQLGSTVKMNII